MSALKVAVFSLPDSKNLSTDPRTWNGWAIEGDEGVVACDPSYSDPNQMLGIAQKTSGFQIVDAVPMATKSPWPHGLLVALSNRILTAFRRRGSIYIMHD